MGNGDIELKIGAKPDPSLKAVSEEVRKEVQAAAAAVTSASREEERELDAVAEASERVSRAFAATSDRIQSGSVSAGRSLLQARIAVDDLREAVDRAQQEGSPIPPEALAQLAAAEDRFGALRGEVSRLQAAQKDLNDDLSAGQVALEGEIGPITSLNDLLRLGGSRWAGYGAQVTAVIGTFQIAYEQGEKLRGLINNLGKELGLGTRAFDDWIQSSLRLESVGTLLVNLLNGEIDATTELTNQMRLLDAAGIAHSGTVEDITAKYAALVARQREAILVQQGVSDSLREFTESVAGVDVKTLEADMGRLVGVVESFNGNLSGLVDSPLFSSFKEEVLAADLTLRKFGDAFRSTLSEEDRAKFDEGVTAFREQVFGQLGPALTDYESKAEAARAKTEALASALLDTLPAGAKSAADAIKALADQGDADFKRLTERQQQAASAPAGGRQGAGAGSGARTAAAEAEQLRRRIDELNAVGYLTAEQDEELQTATQRLQDLEFAAQETTVGVSVLGPAVASTSDAFHGLSVNTTDTVDALGRLPWESTSEAMVRIAADAARVGAATRGTAVELRRGADGFQVISNAAAESKVQFRESADGLKEISDGAATGTVELRRHGTASKEASARMGDLGAAAGKTADSVGKLGPAAEAASDRVIKALGPIEEAIGRNEQKAGSLLRILLEIGRVSFSGAPEPAPPPSGGAG